VNFNTMQVGPGPYAASTDFCKIFESQMDSLYLLSLLLTADEALAEKCFVQGLDDARNGNRVFRDWAESWARRTVIMNAIRAVRPSPENGTTHSISANVGNLDEIPQIRAVLDLPTFDRFVYVVCVLEGHSDRECALLFGCTRDAVVKARVRAFQVLGNPTVVQQQLASAASDRTIRPERSLQVPPPALAVPA